MRLKRKLAYWLLGTDETEVREQFRRVERELGRDVELTQVQALLHIDPARKPEPYNVSDRVENFFERWPSFKTNKNDQ